MAESNPSIFSKAHVASMLLFINDRGRVKENDLTAVCKNYYTSVKVVKILVEANLVHSWVDDSGRSTTYYELTPLGVDVARDLKRANDRVLGLVPEPEDNFSLSPEVRGSAKE